MKDRGIKKWAPFHSVINTSELLKKEEITTTPNLSKDEIQEYEELLKDALYTNTKVKITYLEKGSKKELTDYVLKLDSIKKDIHLKSKKINFRQIYSVKK